jgi:aspartate aminotransferase-like enzyme
MLHKNRLFTPGPTPLLPAAQTAMASFTAHHRTADFRQLFQRVLADMKDFVGTQNDVLVLACSGTGVMEASVSNLTSPGDKVLVLTAGKFGERWTGLAKAFGCNVDVLSVPYGQTFSLNEIRAKITPDVKAVFVQATESSTGARHDVEGIAKIVRASGERHAAGGGRDHRAGHDSSRCGRLGRGLHHRRLTEGADDASRPRILRGERARVEADGYDDFSALLLRPA